jgi:hypothetical protein
MTKQARNIPLLVAATLVAAACGGGHSSGGAPPAASMPLTIGAIADISVAQDTKVPVQLTVTEAPSLPITVTAASSDTTLLPPGAIQVANSNGSAVLNITPADGAVGSAVITVTATDSAGKSAAQTFSLTFNAVYASFAALALGTYAAADTATPVPVLGKTYLDDADDPSTFSALLQ